MTKKQTKELIDALNESRSSELAAISQYMNHHYECKGMESLTVKDLFRAQALEEMGHAEQLAERITALGGIPTLKSGTVKRGKTVKEMLKIDCELEQKAIKRYKAQIKLAEKLGDTTTRRMLEDILISEEAHADAHEALLS